MGQRGWRFFVFGTLAFFSLSLLWPYEPRIEQPIQYNHKIHIAAGLECSNCHTLYETTAWAGRPDLDTCMTCHQEPLTQSPEERKLLTLAEQGGALEWKPINRLPAHVYFSHRTHTVDRKIPCADCHGPMQEATVPPSHPYFEWTMEACMNCHARQQATLDCNGCHR